MQTTNVVRKKDRIRRCMLEKECYLEDLEAIVFAHRTVVKIEAEKKVDYSIITDSICR